MIIQHNMAAMNANRLFGINKGTQAKTTEKLSSGYRINRAADDAAGLAISEKMRRQIRGLTQGTQNAQDGVSLCQVADGALSEVNDMLHRITELTVKASNGTLSDEDRKAIQQEINQIIQEIDRISDATTFNDWPVFKGRDEIVVGADGTPEMQEPVGFDDIALSTLTLEENPFSGAENNISILGIAAKVNKPGHPDNGTVYNLAFSSHETVHLKVNDIPNDSFSYVPGSLSEKSGAISRKFSVDSIDVTQKIKVINGTDEKKYEMTFEFENKGSDSASLDFMFNIDTAYNNGDHVDNYYIAGSLLEQCAIYKGSNATIGDVATNENVTAGIPGSLSLVDADNSLAFSQKMSWSGANTPDVVAVGPFDEIRKWGGFDNAGINRITSQSTNAKTGYTTDLGYTLIWNDKEVPAGGKWSVTFYSGIADVLKDPNLHETGITPPGAEAVTQHIKDPIWIQSGAEAGDGLFIEIGELSSGILGIDDLDVSDEDSARVSIDLTKDALKKLSEMRSDIGAYQNRLTHTILNEDNIVENSTAAESQIRDTDMASEMVKYSLNNILLQSGTSMLAQANQTNQSVLSLLQ